MSKILTCTTCYSSVKAVWSGTAWSGKCQACKTIVFYTPLPKDVNQTPTNPEGTELDQILEQMRMSYLLSSSSHGLEDAIAQAKAAILQWHTTLVEQAVLEAVANERVERLEELIAYANSHPPLMADDIMLSRLYKAKSQQAGKEKG